MRVRALYSCWAVGSLTPALWLGMAMCWAFLWAPLLALLLLPVALLLLLRQSLPVALLLLLRQRLPVALLLLLRQRLRQPSCALKALEARGTTEAQALTTAQTSSVRRARQCWQCLMAL